MHTKKYVGERGWCGKLTLKGNENKMGWWMDRGIDRWKVLRYGRYSKVLTARVGRQWVFAVKLFQLYCMFENAHNKTLGKYSTEVNDHTDSLQTVQNCLFAFHIHSFTWERVRDHICSRATLPSPRESPSTPCFFLSLGLFSSSLWIFVLSALIETVQFGLSISSPKPEKHQTKREKEKCISCLPPLPSAPPWARPPSSASSSPSSHARVSLCLVSKLVEQFWPGWIYAAQGERLLPLPRLFPPLHWLSFLGLRDFCRAEFYGWYVPGHLS